MSKAQIIGNQQMIKEGKKSMEDELFNFKMCLFEQNINGMYSYTQGVEPTNSEMQSRADDFEKVEGQYLRAAHKKQAEYDTFVYRTQNPPDRPYDTNH